MAAFAATGVILSATYMLWMFQRVNYGPVTNEKNAALPDLKPREWALLVPVIALCVVMGVFPNVFLKPMEPSVERMLGRVPGRADPHSGGRTAGPARRCPLRWPSQCPGTADMFSSFHAIVPMACVTAAGIAAMMAEAFRAPDERMPIGPLGAIGLTGAAVATALLWGRNTTSFGVVSADNFGLFVTGVLIVIGFLSLAISGPVIERERLPRGEYYALMLFALAGMMLMATASDLLVIFLALEVLSLAIYVLTGIRRDSAIGSEGAFKYFVLGAFSSAFFLYGIAFVYGVTGSTRLDRIGTLMAAQAMAPTPMQLMAVGLLLVGFAFKVSAVPFHMWTPDAYEGAPPAVTGFMSTGVKAAAFAAFARVFLSALEPLSSHWSMLVWAIAAATMIVGTIVGVSQSSVKRMLAYSSIAHGGYLLVALVSANDVGKGAILFYLLVYAVTNLGAFGIISMLDTADRPNDQIADYAGLWNERPRSGAAHDVLPALARRIPAARRIHRQMVRVQCGDQGRLRVAGHHRRPDERGVGVLLRARHRDDVHDAGGVACRCSCRCRGSPERRLSRRRSSCSISGCCRRVCSTGPPHRFARFSERRHRRSRGAGAVTAVDCRRPAARALRGWPASSERDECLRSRWRRSFRRCCPRRRGCWPARSSPILSMWRHSARMSCAATRPSF